MPRNLTIILNGYQILALVIILAQVSCSPHLRFVRWFTRPVSVLTLFFLSPGYNIVEMAYPNPREKQSCMVIAPDLIREIERHGRSYSTQIFCPKRNEQKQKRNLWQGRALYTLERLSMPEIGWGV
jgi:hypothetical protein